MAPNIMKERLQAAAERLAAEAEAATPPEARGRRPQPMLNVPRPSGNLIAAFIVATVFALIFAFSLFGGPAPAEEQRAPTVAAPGAALPAPTAEQERVSAPVEAPAPAPTAEGYIIGTYPAEQPQLAPSGPQAAPALVEAPVVYSELVPLPPTAETAPRLCERAGVGPCRGSRP
jgi:hypothetical protein